MKTQKIIVCTGFYCLSMLFSCQKAPEKTSGPSSTSATGGTTGTTTGASCSLVQVQDSDGNKVNYTYNKSNLVTNVAQDFTNADNLYGAINYDAKNRVSYIIHSYNGCRLQDSLSVDYNPDETINKVHIYTGKNCTAEYEAEYFEFFYDGNKKLFKINYYDRLDATKPFSLTSVTTYKWDSKFNNIIETDEYDGQGVLTDAATLTYDTKKNVFGGMFFTDPAALEDENFDEMALNANNVLTATDNNKTIHFNYQYNSNNYPSSQTTDDPTDFFQESYKYNCK